MDNPLDYEIVEFSDQQMFREWLAAHGADTQGIWLRIYKKASGVATITYAEALDEALCFGWIDGLKRSYDELSFLQKFTPRRPKSMWSKRNIEHIERLTAQGLMMPAGMVQVEQAKADGRWDEAYDAPSEMVIPAEFLAELKKHPVAEKFYATLNKANTYAIAWQLQTAKTEETRRRRQAKIIALLDAEQKLH